MSAATCPTDLLGLVFAAVHPPSARKRLPEVCRHWNAAFCSSTVLWSDVRADFDRLSRGLLNRYGEMLPDDAAKYHRRRKSLAAWLARRAGSMSSLHIIWPSNDYGSSISLPSVLQQRMPHLASLTIQCSDLPSSVEYSRQPCLRFAEVACLAAHQPQLTALSFGRVPGEMFFPGLPSPPYDEPPMTWLTSLQQLQRLELPGFFLHPHTIAALSMLTGLASLGLHLDSHAARQSLQGALEQLHGLTSLSVALSGQEKPAWQLAAAALVAGEGVAAQAAPLQVGGLPRLAELRLNGGSVRGLTTAAPSLTWLQLHDTSFQFQDLLGCSRLVGLEVTLYTFNSCLEGYILRQPSMECSLPPGCLPALRTLSFRSVEGDSHYDNPGPLPGELSALTGLTRLQVEGPVVEMQTIEDWKEAHYDTLHRYHSTESDSDTLAQESLENYLEAYGPFAFPGPGFCLPHLRELSLISCCLDRVPKFVAGLPDLHTLRVNGNVFHSQRQIRKPAFFPGLPGPVCSSLRRLEMRGCFLPGVPPVLSHLTALTALDLSGSRKLEIRRSDVEVFSRLTRLRELRLAKPLGPIHKRAEWSQASVAALLAVQRACGWLDAASGLELEGGEAEEGAAEVEGEEAAERWGAEGSDAEGSDQEASSDDDWAG